MVNDEMELSTGMTDLAERLQGPEKAELSQALRNRLSEIRAGIRAEIAAGVPPESAVRYTSLLQALVAAERVVLLAGTPPEQTARHLF